MQSAASLLLQALGNSPNMPAATLTQRAPQLSPDAPALQAKLQKCEDLLLRDRFNLPSLKTLVAEAFELRQFVLNVYPRKGSRYQDIQAHLDILLSTLPDLSINPKCRLTAEVYKHWAKQSGADSDPFGEFDFCNVLPWSRDNRLRAPPSYAATLAGNRPSWTQQLSIHYTSLLMAVRLCGRYVTRDTTKLGVEFKRFLIQPLVHHFQGNADAALIARMPADGARFPSWQEALVYVLDYGEARGSDDRFLEFAGAKLMPSKLVNDADAEAKIADFIEPPNSKFARLSSFLGNKDRDILLDENSVPVKKGQEEAKTYYHWAHNRYAELDSWLRLALVRLMHSTISYLLYDMVDDKKAIDFQRKSSNPLLAKNMEDAKDFPLRQLALNDALKIRGITNLLFMNEQRPQWSDERKLGIVMAFGFSSVDEWDNSILKEDLAPSMHKYDYALWLIKAYTDSNGLVSLSMAHAFAKWWNTKHKGQANPQTCSVTNTSFADIRDNGIASEWVDAAQSKRLAERIALCAFALEQSQTRNYEGFKQTSPSLIFSQEMNKNALRISRELTGSSNTKTSQPQIAKKPLPTPQQPRPPSRPSSLSGLSSSSRTSQQKKKKPQKRRPKDHEERKFKKGDDDDEDHDSFQPPRRRQPGKSPKNRKGAGNSGKRFREAQQTQQSRGGSNYDAASLNSSAFAGMDGHDNA